MGKRKGEKEKGRATRGRREGKKKKVKERKKGGEEKGKKRKRKGRVRGKEKEKTPTKTCPQCLCPLARPHLLNFSIPLKILPHLGIMAHNTDFLGVTLCTMFGSVRATLSTGLRQP